MRKRGDSCKRDETVLPGTAPKRNDPEAQPRPFAVNMEIPWMQTSVRPVAWIGIHRV